MSKNNRQRRKEKQARLKKKREFKKNKKRLSSQDGYFLHRLENPFDNMSKEDRKNVISEIQKNAEKGYKESLEDLEKILSEYYPILLLSFLANYYLTTGVSDDGIVSFDKDQQINQADIEICQAIMLQQNPEKLQFNIPPLGVYQKLVDILSQLSTASHQKNMKAEFLDLDEKEGSAKMVQEYVKMHTQTVRNWGHFAQVKSISHELYSAFDDMMLSSFGFISLDVIEFFDYLIKKTEEGATSRFINLKRLKKYTNKKILLEKYLELIGNEKDAEEALKYLYDRSREEVFLAIIAHYDLMLPGNYIFNIDDIVHDTTIDKGRIISIVNQFSYAFAGLEKFNTEYLFLGNPIWTKPIVLLSKEEFFCPMPQLFFSFILKSFDKLIEQVDPVKLSDVKAEYLENKVEEIVKIRFPETNTIQSLKWKDNDKEYETDLITFIDSYAIIFEAKSGKITDEALRGADNRLKKKINELLVEPNIQSRRLKEKLEYLIKHPEQEDEVRKKLPVDLNKIHKVLRVSVTLEYFASLQSSISDLEKTGWIPGDYSPCPTMSISDFEVLFDLFDHPVQIINYLELREEIEGEIKYKGDELDLMAIYMENHLNFADIDPNVSLMITGMSEKIDNYYQSKELSINIEKPKPKMNRYFEKILEQVEFRKIERWTEIGSIIYRLFPEDQLKIINLLNKIKNNVRKNWTKIGHKNIVNYVPPLSSKYAFSFVVFCDANKEKRHEFLEEAIAIGLESEHVEHCLGIGINIDRNDLPYALISVANKDENV